MPPHNPHTRPSLPWLALALLLVAGWLCYLPGLHGDFLFDDFVNLPALGATGPVDNMAAFWRYITSGTADPTGRPLALLSFLLDARDWPADPATLLRTNLVLHLINGALLFALLRTLGRWLDGACARTDAAAVLGAGLWLLHPLFVSTTLYIVQREAMLPVTCMLLGLLAWLHGRRLLADCPRAGMAWMVFGIGLGTLLALLSKANGALLPVLAWVLDATILRQSAPDPATARRLRQLRLVLLVLPSLAIFAYVLSQLTHLGDALDTRPWTIGERLLTEPRVLLDYLRLLVVPRALSTGLYNDAYVFSTGLLQPPTTLPALLVVLGLVVAGFALRRPAPALAAALLFYFAGHLLESTTIPLELYFEHRNYLPAVLLGWPLARAVCRWQVAGWVRGLVAIGLLTVLAAITWQRSALWADQDQMALLWAAQNPASSRAQATAASFQSRAGHADQAMARLAGPWRQQPDDLQLALNYVNAACAVRGLHPYEVDAVAVALRTATEGDQLLYRWLGRALDTAQTGQCQGIDLAVIGRWIDAARANPRLADMPGRQQDLHALSGRLALARGDAATALAEFNRGLDASPTPQAAAKQAALLASSSALDQALAHLDHYAAIEHQREPATGWNMQRIHAWVLARQGFWQHELSTLRQKIQADKLQAEKTAKHQGSNATSTPSSRSPPLPTSSSPHSRE